ncbi:OLC1v1000241C1 [Oldenlandia corymbosa var. corymbosa]|uniref:OLC1v1000241C1 n=1 Tax=Oldenlandia corymbosa var. corymbosa TaxID=529605 RepID=A0AAV1D3D8_OLDCO|nr:OLC1v1000241C1 [Oldenlandia corymbosa var. corymbosa]
MKLTMENSQSQIDLATDSFSYSWLINDSKSSSSSFDGLLESLRRPSLENYDHNDDSIPIFNTQIFKDGHQEFDFRVNHDHHQPGAGGESSRFSINLVHADELFCDGCIRPVFINQEKHPVSVPVTPIHSSSSVSVSSGSGFLKNQGQSFSSGDAKCRKKLSAGKKVLQGCCGGLSIRPIYRVLGCSRTRVRVDDLDRKVLEVGKSRGNSVPASPERRRSWNSFKKSRSSISEKLINHSPQASPISSSCSPLHYSSSSIPESSIHEAILHCKRSFAN